MEISCARDLPAVLRKHWRGDHECTAELFSCRNPDAKPEMRAWCIGDTERATAKIYLNRWAEAFRAGGYEVFGVQSEGIHNKEHHLNFLDRERLAELAPEKVIRGQGVRIITCGLSEKKSAQQKYGTEPVDAVLNIRTTEQVAEAFRDFCKENDLTENQGLALLLSGRDAAAGVYLNRDLCERLDAADGVVEEKKAEIHRLRKVLEEERSKRQESRLDHLARLQNSLLQRFFANLPTPVLMGRSLKRQSARTAREEFRDAGLYTFPEECVLLLRLEYVQYVKGNSQLLMIYGRTEDGQKRKLCWRINGNGRRGVSIWDSEYLIAGYPWLFAVYKPKAVSYAVYALPLFDLTRIIQWYESVDDDEYLEQTHCFSVPFFEDEDGDTEEEADPNEQASLEEKIRRAEQKKG